MKIANIYDIAYDALQYIMDTANSYESLFTNIIKFISDENFGTEPLEDAKKIWHFDITNVKIISMFMLFEFAYLVNLYDAKRLKNKETILEELESLNPSDIVRLFKEKSDIWLAVIESAEYYLNNTYIYKYCCWANLIACNKQRALLRINPFILLEYEDNVLGDGFKEMEATIQLFSDFYDSAVVEERANNKGYSTDMSNEYIIETFLKMIKDYFKDPQSINEFYSLVFSNIYEYLVAYMTSSPSKTLETESIIDELESSSVESLIEKFENDPTFTQKIIDIFFTINDFLQKDDLIDRRITYLEGGNDPKYLMKFNPYYHHDEQVLKRYKNNSSN